MEEEAKNEKEFLENLKETLLSAYGITSVEFWEVIYDMIVARLETLERESDD
jgi:hypothetical protein